jgi:hypothetical protein
MRVGNRRRLQGRHLTIAQQKVLLHPPKANPLK